MMKSRTYKQSGVDIKKADVFIKGLRKIFSSKKGSSISAFASFFELGKLVKKYKDPVLVSSSDGVGTKLLLAQQLKKHFSVGIDLVAMNVNDIICLGAKPLFFLDYIACGKLKPTVMLEVAKGIKNGLDQSDCCLCGGETAEMPGMYKEDEYDLAGFCVGIVDKKQIIDGRKIKKGDVVLGLESSGLHSNGFSLARKALSKNDLNKYARHLLVPTRIYVKPILSLLSAIGHRLSAVKGIAHVTGGAFYEKAVKILPQGLSMMLDKESWPIPDIFKVIQKRGKISDKEMYKVFNMGVGMILVVEKRQAMSIAAHLQKYLYVHVIGEIVKSNKRMILK